MIDNYSTEKSKNKGLIIKNKSWLQKYALKSRALFGQGIVVVNLLLLETDNFTELNLIDDILEDAREPTVHQPVSYIPQASFWFKTISLKIKNKYQIDLQTEDNLGNKFLIVFIKDDSIEHFSIYAIAAKDIKETVN